LAAKRSRSAGLRKRAVVRSTSYTAHRSVAGSSSSAPTSSKRRPPTNSRSTYIRRRRATSCVRSPGSSASSSDTIAPSSGGSKRRSLPPKVRTSSYDADSVAEALERESLAAPRAGEAAAGRVDRANIVAAHEVAGVTLDEDEVPAGDQRCRLSGALISDRGSTVRRDAPVVDVPQLAAGGPDRIAEVVNRRGEQANWAVPLGENLMLVRGTTTG